MKRYFKTELTVDQYNTILAAVQIEMERNYGTKEGTLLKDAFEALHKAEVTEH